MNKYFSYLLVFFAFFFSFSLYSNAEPEFTTKKVIFDLGTIKKKSPIKKIKVPFKNTGDSKLVITDAKSICACTKVEYPKDFIAPGKSGKLLITLDVSQIEPHQMEKHVKVFTNTKNSPVVLILKAKIVN